MMTLKKKYSRKMLNVCSSFKEYIHIERYMNMIIVYHDDFKEEILSESKYII